MVYVNNLTSNTISAVKLRKLKARTFCLDKKENKSITLAAIVFYIEVSTTKNHF